MMGNKKFVVIPEEFWVFQDLIGINELAFGKNELCQKFASW